MKKLQLIIAREFIAKVKNKSFIIMTFVSPLIALGMIILVFFLMKKNNEKIKEIVYVDHSGLFSKEDFKDTKFIKYTDYTALGIQQTKKAVEQEKYYGVLFIPKKEGLNVLANSIEFYSKESPGFTIIDNIEGNVNRRLQKLKMTQLGIDLKKIKASKIELNIKIFNFSGEESSKLINRIKIGIGTISGYLLMMFLIIYGNSMMRSVIQEKTSRIIEIIVSSVKPFQLMLGKIIGNGSAGLVQFFIWGILILIISFAISSFLGIDIIQMQQTAKVSPEALKTTIEHTTNDSTLLIQEIFRLPLIKIFFLFIFYFLGGYFLYSSLFAAVGAAVDSETDTQQFVMPIMMPLMLAVYVGGITVINDPHGPVSIIFSYIPFTSPIVMLMRVPFGVSWWEISISMALLIVTFVAFVWLAAKIYRVGILMYGKKASYKDLWKWLKYKG